MDVLVHTTIGEGKTAWDATLIEQMRAKDMAVVPTLKLFPYELGRAELPRRVVQLASADSVEQVRAYPGDLRAFTQAGTLCYKGT